MGWLLDSDWKRQFLTRSVYETVCEIWRGMSTVYQTDPCEVAHPHMCTTHAHKHLHIEMNWKTFQEDCWYKDHGTACTVRWPRRGLYVLFISFTFPTWKKKHAWLLRLRLHNPIRKKPPITTVDAFVTLEELRSNCVIHDHHKTKLAYHLHIDAFIINWIGK